MTPHPQARARRIRTAGFIAAVLTFVALADVAAVLAFWRSGESVRTEPFDQADVAIVYYTDDADAAARRVRAGLSLLHQNRVHAILCVGGFRGGAGPSGGARLAAEIVRGGVAPALVFADARSFDTRSNVSSAGAIVERRGWKRIAHVSDAMHLRRIRNAVRAYPAFADTTQFFVASGYAGAGEVVSRAHYELAVAVLDLAYPGGARSLARVLRTESAP